MAKKIAAADPKTLAAAFRAQAHRTARGYSAPRRARPIGNGMPIRKPAGATSPTVTVILRASGQPTPDSLIGDARKASVETAAATAISSALNRTSLALPTRLRL